MKSKLISNEVILALQTRIQNEELSSRLYEQMSLWLNNEGYLNLAKLYTKFSTEEMSHAKWAKDYLLSFGVMPVLPDLDAPVNKFTNVLEIITKTVNHETMITEQCRELGKQGLSSGDLNLFELASQYNKEQIEEMDKVITLQDLLNTFGSDRTALLILDTHLDEYFEF